MARLRQANVLTMLIALVLFLAACGMNEQPMENVDAPAPGEIAETDDGKKDDGAKDGDEKDDAKDDEKDGDKDGDKDGEKDDEKEKDDEVDGGTRGTAMEECAYIADLQGVEDTWFGATHDGHAPWLVGVEVDFHEDEDGTETVSWDDVDAEDGIDVQAVKVYGGENPATYYYYDAKDGAFEDDGLVAEPKKEGPSPVTDVVVCVTLDFEPVIAKTAEVELVHDWDWELGKSAVDEGPEADDLAFVLDVDATLDEIASVSGEVTIHNPAPFPMKVKDLDDLLYADAEYDVELTCTLESGGDVDIDDGVAAHGTVVCTYEQELLEMANGENLAILEYAYDVKGEHFGGTVEADADVSFDDVEPVVLDATARLEDDLLDVELIDEGDLDDIELIDGSIELEAALDADNTWDIEYAYLPEGLQCGANEIVNVAVLVNADGDVLAEASATAYVNVAPLPLEGWRDLDHPVWDDVDFDLEADFYATGYTYGELLDMDVDDGLFVELAHLVIAADLNAALGLDLSAEVSGAHGNIVNLLNSEDIDFVFDPEADADIDVEAWIDILVGFNGGVDLPYCGGGDDDGDDNDSDLRMA